MDRHLNNGSKESGSKKNMKCHKCRRIFSQFKSLYQHLIQTHADVTPEEIAELEAAHAKCPICFNVFRNEEIMRNHMKKHEPLVTVQSRKPQLPIMPLASNNTQETVYV